MILRILSFSFLLLPFISFGDLQYRPAGSSERHEFSSGYFSYPFEVENLTEDLKSGYFLDYSLYFPEIHKIFQNKYKHFGQLGFTTGVHIFDSEGMEPQIKSACFVKNNQHQPLLFRFGVKAKFSYLENLIPNFEYGWASLACSSELSLETLSSTQFKPIDSSLFNQYVSLGLDISFKIFDRRSIYSLDEDYGINDMGLSFKCALFFPDDKDEEDVPEHITTAPTATLKKTDSRWICQAGLNILF